MHFGGSIAALLGWFWGADFSIPAQRDRVSVYALDVRALLFAALLFASACGPSGGSLALSAIAPHSASVAQEVVIPLLADGAGTFPIGWAWQSPSNPELATRLHRPTLSAYSGGRALWRFTPLATDVGPLQIEFSATKGPLSGSLTLDFVIDPGGDPPVFREPVGEGTTLDLKAMPCAVVSVVVEADSSPQVTLSLLNPPPNAEVAQTEELAGKLVFCPSATQAMTETIYPLLLQAEAGSHIVRKSYVIVLRRSA